MDFEKIAKKSVPYLVAIGLFLVLTLAYFQPMLKGKELKQNDVIQFKGMSKAIFDYREAKGDEPLWTNSVFSGMPALGISFRPKYNVSRYIHKIFQAGLPRAATPVFVAMLGFFILLLVVGANPWQAALGGLAYGLSSFLLISIEAGHNTKTHCMAYMPLVIAGIITTYQGRLLLGAGMTALFLSIQVYHGHIQIIYYTLILTIILVITYGIIAIKSGALSEYLKGSAFLLVAALLAVGPNSGKLMNTYVYGKETMRGGSSELTAKKDQNKQGGLDYDYAMRWSQGRMETFTLLIPNFRGGGSGEALSEDSDVFKTLRKRGVSKKQAQNIIQRMPTYWGDQPFTSGPIYIGAIVCFLFVLGLFTIKHPVKWGLLAAFILSLLLAWGKNSIFVSDFFFDYVPLYNKFRTPAMTLALTGFIVPFIGFWGLKEWMSEKFNKQQKLKTLKLAASITLGIIVLIGFIGSYTYDFKGPNDTSVEAQYTQAIDATFGKSMISAIRKDRSSMMINDALRSLVFVLLASGILWLIIGEKMKPKYALSIIGVLIVVDLWQIDKRYLNDENFIKESKYKKIFIPTQADQQIKQDKDPFYRVFNYTRDPFNDAMTSYHHNSVGGYHPAKLIRYQDMIERHLSKSNMDVFNMLNTKYFIVKNQQTGQPQAQRNNAALGNVWFVKTIKWAENADQEIAMLNDFNPSNEVVIDQRYKDDLNGFTQGNGEGTIQLTTYDLKHMVYQSNTTSNQFAVFSEIFYNGNKDWKAYVDGEYVEHIRVNYILRGMKIPSGKHKIEFKFEPKVVATGETIALTSSVLLVLMIVGSFGWYLKPFLKSRQNPNIES